MKGNSRVRSILGNVDTIIACVVLALLVVLTFAGVIFRYAIGQPFTWLEEVQTSRMVWSLFAAAGPGVPRGQSGCNRNGL